MFCFPFLNTIFLEHSIQRVTLPVHNLIVVVERECMCMCEGYY